MGLLISNHNLDQNLLNVANASLFLIDIVDLYLKYYTMSYDTMEFVLGSKHIHNTLHWPTNHFV